MENESSWNSLLLLRKLGTSLPRIDFIALVAATAANSPRANTDDQRHLHCRTHGNFTAQVTEAGLWDRVGEQLLDQG